MPEGKDYCERKIHLLKSNFDQLVEVINLFDFDICISTRVIVIFT